MEYVLDLRQVRQKTIMSLGDPFRGQSQRGDELAFNNYYLARNGNPFFGISGEVHFSRLSDGSWEDELLKMKAGGINIIATYVFWIHHEFQEGVFDFSGRRNLRRFIELCHKHDLYVILRVGPFCHGEVRNGGLPDWLYGKPFEVRQLNPGWLDHTRRLYSEIARQVQGLFFRDNGPIIGVQIDNEYMHSSAPWEMTAGTAHEWVFGGNEGEAYMLTLKDLAADCGLNPVFYTATAWGGAIVPDSMLPLWGGYAFRPWLFYSHRGEHPLTDEYVYQDFHSNLAQTSYDFHPTYLPEDRPYSCCEMGGGMMVSYNYRFQFPYKSVDAMANIKLASGCNFLGYYMFHGGSNPVLGPAQFLNEGQVSKVSYDYQAALGEYGQLRESYRRLKSLHHFVTSFQEELCPLPTVLPEGQSSIDPGDLQTLRYAVRSDGHRGFLFINNYQDHARTSDKTGIQITLKLASNDLTFKDLSLAGDENCVLPFNLDLAGITLVQAAAQLLAWLDDGPHKTYAFLIPDGMQGSFIFEQGAQVNGEPGHTYRCREAVQMESFTVEKDGVVRKILCLSRGLADSLYRVEGGWLFTAAALLEKDTGYRLQSPSPRVEVMTYPPELLEQNPHAHRLAGESCGMGGTVGTYELLSDRKDIELTIQQISPYRYTVAFPSGFLSDLKDVLLRIEYQGDIGEAFLGGQMVSDNFFNGSAWEIGLKDFAALLEDQPLTLKITPLKEGAKVHVDSPMAARHETADVYRAALNHVSAEPVYEFIL